MTRPLPALVGALIALCAPASALDIRSSAAPGTAPPALTNGEIAINRADKRLIFKNVDGTLGYGSLLNALPSGRKAVEQGDASDLIIGSGGPTIPAALAGKAPTSNPIFTGIVKAPAATITDGNKTALQVYTAPYPEIGVSDGGFTDTNVGIRHIPAGHNLGNNVTAVAGYVWNETDRGTQPTNAGNGISLFGVGVGNSNTARTWGINTLLTDNATRNVSSWTQQFTIGAELDFNITSPSTQVLGVSVGGNSLVQPTTSVAYSANSLGHLTNGTPIRWGAGFQTYAGSANVAVVAAPLNETANSPSQPIWWVGTNASNVNAIASARFDSGFLILDGATSGVKATNADLLLDPGHSFKINGQSVVGDRRTGWTTGTGTPNRGAYNADYTQTISATYSQAQIQALQSQLLATQQRVLALEADLRAHGLIGQ